MVDVLMSNENLSVFGGPASLDINVDFGAPGVRGSLIFTGPGKPTDALVTFSTPPRPQDLYINLLPSDFEYLFLYQYGSVNGVLSWSKVLRLIPNTAIANIPVIFIDGVASTLVPTAEGLAYIQQRVIGPPSKTVTEVIAETIAATTISPIEPSSPTLGMLWLDVAALPFPELKVYSGISWVKLAAIRTGLFFPISDYFSSEEIAVGATSGFNVQYVILNQSPISSGLQVGSLTEEGSKLYLPVYITAAETPTFAPGSALTWQKINGIRVLSFVLVANIGTLPLI
jgi:hypothetical protein